MDLELILAVGGGSRRKPPSPTGWSLCGLNFPPMPREEPPGFSYQHVQVGGKKDKVTDRA